MRPAFQIASALALACLAPGTRAAAQASQSSTPPRSGVVVETAHRSGAVPRCWNAYLQSQPEAGSVRFRVRIEVNAAGAFHHVTVLDPAPLPLVGCVQTQLGHLSVAAGSALTVETTYSFAAGSPAPVPAGMGPAAAQSDGATAPPATAHAAGPSAPGDAHTH